jgi:hypothetical protein
MERKYWKRKNLVNETYPQNTERCEGNQFVEDPRLVVFDIEKDRMFVPVRVDSADDECSN